MKHCNTPGAQTTGRLVPIACAVALAVACAVSLPHPVSAADRIRRPRVPDNLEVPAGNKVFLKGAADGTQNYICRPSGSSVAWVLFGPQATLFNHHSGQQIITHFLSPNPDEGDMPRATWQHSRDTSKVWARMIASAPNNSECPSSNSNCNIPLLLLEVVGAEPGISRDRLMGTTYIQRLNTFEGVAPMDGCAMPTDAGKTALVHYTADYVFYKATDSDEDDDH